MRKCNNYQMKMHHHDHSQINNTNKLVIKRALDALSSVGEQEKELATSVRCALVDGRARKMLARVCFLFDSGSDAHITSNKNLFIDGTIRKCSVDVFGISDDESVRALHAIECGSVRYEVGGSSVVLHDVLYVSDAVLGRDPRTVLVSVSKFVVECGLGVHFVHGGERVEFTTGENENIRVVDSFKIDAESSMFCDFKTSNL